MRRRRLFAVGLFCSIALASFASGTAVVVASRSPGRGRLARARMQSPALTVAIRCRAPAMGGSLPAVVYLPVGYRSSSRRYRVVYFLHGLPASPTSYTQNAFVAAAVAAGGRAAIVVAPQGARAPDSDPEYLDWDPHENWPRAISHDLTRCIDSRYRTIANRYGRALIGLSAGGYGAFNVGLRNLPTFAAVQSWSGYFAATDPAGLHVLDLGSPAANAAAVVPSGPVLAGSLVRWPALIAFYVGRQDARFLNMNEQYDAELRADGIGHVFHVYPGGHQMSLWRGQAPHWLGMALSYLSWASRHRSRSGGSGV